MRNISSLKATIQHIWKYGRYVLVIIPFLWIASRTQFDLLVQSIHRLPVWTIPAVSALILTAMMLQGIRWWVLLHAQLPSLKIGTTLSCHFVGLFYGLVLPSSAGQDLVRALILSRNADFGVVWGATWICRLFGLLALAFVATAGFLGAKTTLLPDLKLYMILSCAILLALFILSFSKKLTRPIRIALGRISKFGFILEKLDKIRQSIYLYRGMFKSLAITFVLTITIQLILVFTASVMLKCVTGKFFAWECLLYIPLIEIACLSIPLTPNGIGIRDGLVAVLFKNLGITNEQTSLYLIIGFTPLLLRFIGIFFIPAVGGLPKKGHHQPSEIL